MAPKIKVYADPCTINCHKVLGALDAMKVPYELVYVDYFKAEQKSEENTKLNPSQTVPFALLEGKTNKAGRPFIITESNAILQYAADHQDNEEYYPKDLAERANINRWLNWEAAQWFASCYVYVVENVVKPLLGAEPDQKTIEAEAPRMHKLCKILDDTLADHKYLTGDHITIADFSVASPMHLYEESKLPLENYPNLRRWQREQMENCHPWMKAQEAVYILVPNSEKAKAAKAKLKSAGASDGAAHATESGAKAQMAEEGAEGQPASSSKEIAKAKTNGAITSSNDRSSESNGAVATSQNGVTNGVNGHSNGSTKAMFNYTKDDETRPPTLYFYDDPKAATIREPGDDPVEQTIHDGWSRAKEFSIDKHGFSLDQFSTDFDAWEDESRTQKEFYPQIVDFLKKKLGCKRVLVFDHTIRSARNDGKKLTQETNTSQRSPVMLVHCDYTAESGPLRIKQLLKEEADELLKGRCAFVNVWKPVRVVVEEKPLAMCDVTTSPDADFMKLYLHYRDRIGENYVMRHSDSQKWYYFPKMTPEQVILLKTFDSATDGTARFVGHTAFVDPNSPPNAPQRESCEIRTIVFY